MAVRTWQDQHPPLAADGRLEPETWDMPLPEVRAYSGGVPAGGWGDPPSDLAVPVTTAEAAAASRRGVATLPTTGRCGTLRVGQVWAGVAGGNRVIVALTATDVVFVTAGGQAYHQPAAGWDADFTGGPSAGGRRPAPLDTLHETEVQALLGAVAAAGEAGFLVAVGVETGRWVVRHRADLTRLAAALGPVARAAICLRAAAPVLSETVVWPAFGGVLSELLGAANRPPRAARAAGLLLVKLGKPALAWNAATLLARLVPVAKYTAAGEAAALARELTRLGAAVTPEDAGRVLREVRANPVEITWLIDLLRHAVRALL